MSPRRGVLIGMAGGFVAGCGAGGSSVGVACPETAMVSWYGDSITSGFALDIRPVRAAAELLGPSAVCLDRSWPGVVVSNHVGRWESTVEMDPATVLVLRFGGADTLTLTPKVEFINALSALTVTAMRHGKKVVIPGVIRMARKPVEQEQLGWDDAQFEVFRAHSLLLDSATREVALRFGATWVDIQAVSFSGPSDLVDAVHPAQGYSDRCVNEIVRSVKRELQ